MKYRYRILPRLFGFEPQMQCKATLTGRKFWTPLNRDGYWSDPTSCDNGVVFLRAKMGLIEAFRAICHAKRINGQNANSAGDPPTND